MSRHETKRGFLRRLSKNLENVDKRTLLTHLESESSLNENWGRVFDYLEEGVILVSPQGQIEYINTAAKNFTGIQSETSKVFWEECADPELKDFFSSNFNASQSEITQTFRVLEPLERNLKVSIRPHALETSAGTLILMQDLTHPILPEMERLARNRMDALMRLAGGLAHEIGNPLNAISLHLELLKKQIQKLPAAESSKLEAASQTIQDEVRRLDKIVRSFLKTTRRAPLRFQIQDLCGIIQDVLRVMRPSLEERDIKIDWEAPDAIKFFLDEERIRSLFMNLIQNALEAMPQGGRLSFRLSQIRQTVRIEITDTGKGISAQDLPHIFEAYYTTKEHGSGLGLLFVYDAVMDHGGKINVESRPGKGTRFEILFPLRRSNLQIKHESKRQGGSEHASL